MDKRIEDYWHYYDSVSGTEHAKNQLIEVGALNLPIINACINILCKRLLEELVQLKENYEQEQLDHRRESQCNRDGQLREQKLNEELRKLKVRTVC